MTERLEYWGGLFHSIFFFLNRLTLKDIKYLNPKSIKSILHLLSPITRSLLPAPCTHTPLQKKIKKQWRLDGTAIALNQKVMLSNQDRRVACLAIWIDFVFVFVFRALIIAGDYPVVWSSDSQCVFEPLFSLTGSSQFRVPLTSIQGGHLACWPFPCTRVELWVTSGRWLF